MNEWREKVKAALASAQIHVGSFEIIIANDADLTDYELEVFARAAIAELLPLLKAELANDLRDKHDGRLVSRMAIAAEIEAWEPET